MPHVCRICKKPLIQPIGPPKARLGILGGEPTQEDLQLGKVWSDASDKAWKPNVGRILRAELSHAGLFFGDFRATYVWLHESSEDSSEYNWHLNNAIQTLRKVEFLLVLGSVASQALLGFNAGDIAGIWLQSDLLSHTHIMVAPSPTMLIHGTVGEFRMALETFAKEVKLEG